jgi:tetratricopeptide (TPR) repeat protein
MIWRNLGPARINIFLREGYRSLLLLLVIAFAALFLAGAAFLDGRASSLKTRSEGSWMQTLDPNDPRLEFRLGRVLEQTDPSEAITHFRRATELSPTNRRYRYHLAFACETAGDTQCADGSWELLAKLCPMVPLYSWHAGQSYLRNHQLDDSLSQFRHLLELDPKYGPQVWFTLRGVLDADAIFEKTIAHGDSESQVQYVDFLSSQGDYDAAYRIWKSLAPKLHDVRFSTAKPFLEQLIAEQRMQEAWSVWQDLQKLGMVKPSEGNQRNLVFNGDFEQTPLNAGFDWRWPDVLTFLAVNFESPDGYHGRQCLRVDFTVNRNEEFEPAYQIVPVLPGHNYQLEAYVRSEDISSDTGPYLRVSDPQRLSFPDALSETTIETTAWHTVRVTFSTGANTQTVRISLWRPRGRTFPMGISGSFWLDSVSLHDLGPGLERSALSPPADTSH